MERKPGLGLWIDCLFAEEGVPSQAFVFGVAVVRIPEFGEARLVAFETRERCRR